MQYSLELQLLSCVQNVIDVFLHWSQMLTQQVSHQVRNFATSWIYSIGTGVHFLELSSDDKRALVVCLGDIDLWVWFSHSVVLAHASHWLLIMWIYHVTNPYLIQKVNWWGGKVAYCLYCCLCGGENCLGQEIAAFLDCCRSSFVIWQSMYAFMQLTFEELTGSFRQIISVTTYLDK